MSRKKKNDFRVFAGYGWTTHNPETWVTRMKRSSVKIEHLREEIGFDAIACCGSSGMMAAAVLSVALGVPVIYVRKANEKSHGSSVEANSVGQSISRYLIVDDFVASGNTLDRIVSGIEKFADDHRMLRPECVGAFLYNEDSRMSQRHTPKGRIIKIFT